MFINVWLSEYWVNMFGIGGMVLGVSFVFKFKLYIDVFVKYDGVVDFRQILSDG